MPALISGPVPHPDSKPAKPRYPWLSSAPLRLQFRFGAAHMRGNGMLTITLLHNLNENTAPGRRHVIGFDSTPRKR